MKSFPLVLVLFALLSCSSDDAEPTATKLKDKPFFNSFWISTRFDMPAVETETFTNLEFFNVWAETYSDYDPKEFRYYSSGHGALQPEIVFKVSSKEGILTLNAIGKINRIGDVVPNEYAGDPLEWDAESIEFNINVVAIINSKTVTKASLNIKGATFDANYDITNKIKFDEHDNESLPEWTISFVDDIVKNSDNTQLHLRYAFAVNDVYGTSIKK